MLKMLPIKRCPHGDGSFRRHNCFRGGGIKRGRVIGRADTRVFKVGARWVRELVFELAGPLWEFGVGHCQGAFNNLPRGRLRRPVERLVFFVIIF